MVLAGTALVLASCATTDGVDVEGRDIQVENDVQPAASGPAPPALSGAVAAASPAYVTLTISKGDSDSGNAKEKWSKRAVTSGSGFVVDSAGYVMTAGHVAVEPGYIVAARAANGHVYSGKVVDIQSDNDMALIKLKSYQGKAMSPAANTCLARGTAVVSLGKPHAAGDIARLGQVEAMHFGRPVRYGNFGYSDAMVLRMGTQRGESGGPVLNQSGELVGMVVSTLADGNGRPLNLAHAVPAASLAQFLCGHASCSGSWARLSSQSAASCPDS
jgi:S1-C subfamily serine protease